MAKPDADKVSAEVESMQREIRNLQKALGDLVDALITEEKPGPKEIKKLQDFKKKALAGANSKKALRKKRQQSGRIKSTKES